jgi:hypothetical protein
MGSVFITTPSLHTFALTECDDKLRTAALARLYPSISAVAFGDLPDDGKASAGPLDFSPDGSLEKLKDAFGVLQRHSGTTVADGDTDDTRGSFK